MRKNNPIQSWLCYYGLEAHPDVYGRFDLVVFDSTYHPPLIRRSNGLPVMLGYVSVGEIHVNGPHWGEVKKKVRLVKKNETWQSWVVDVRDPFWQVFVQEEIIPSVLEQGFDGLFIDTMDASLALMQGPGRASYRDTDEALIRMIERIREAHPGTWLAVNRALPILPKIAASIDVVVVESLYSCYAGPDQGYVKVDDETRNLLLEQLAAGLEAAPGLVVLTLDYADADPTSLGREAMAFSRERGFVPCVSDYRLNQIYLRTRRD